MKKIMNALALAAILLLMNGAARAESSILGDGNILSDAKFDKEDDVRRDEEEDELAFDFKFGNDIDTHQRTALLENGELFGFLLITFTGEESEEGIRKAKHCEEETPLEECKPGWIIRGTPGHATLASKEGDHPLWLVHGRSSIPQPGGFSHFHPVGEMEESGAEESMTEGETREGFFLELKAVKEFIFLHEHEEEEGTPEAAAEEETPGEQVEHEIHIRRGLDIASHLNITASFPGLVPPHTH